MHGTLCTIGIAGSDLGDPAHKRRVLSRIVTASGQMDERILRGEDALGRRIGNPQV
jgi:hypothetical protein